MKVNSRVYIIILLACFVQCRKGGPCEEPLFVTNSGLTIDFIDGKTGDYLYKQSFPLFDIDSLTIMDAEGTLYEILTSSNLIPGTISRFDQVSFGPLYISGKDERSNDEKIEKEYYIQYQAGHTDTIVVKYKSEKTKCGSHFNPLEVYQRGILLSTEYEDTGANIVVTKD